MLLTGLSIDLNPGAITGAPTVTGTYSVNVKTLNDSLSASVGGRVQIGTYELGAEYDPSSTALDSLSGSELRLTLRKKFSAGLDRQTARRRFHRVVELVFLFSCPSERAAGRIRNCSWLTGQLTTLPIRKERKLTKRKFGLALCTDD